MGNVNLTSKATHHSEGKEWFSRDILPYLPNPLRSWLNKLSEERLTKLEEIRLRINKPVLLQIGGGNVWLTEQGNLATVGAGSPFILSEELMLKTVTLLSQSSLYALETELSQGYLTLKGGHRIGLTGEALLEQGHIIGMKNFSSINIRLARALPGVADSLVPHLIDQSHQRVYHTLIVSPPGAGKTTLLRDLVRQLSDGVPGLWPGAKIGLVDERSEIAGCFRGIPQKDVGLQTDVLDGCPKAEGMMLLLRSMSPKIIAVDELGRKEDIVSVWEMLNAGVTVVATAHSYNLEELANRPIMGDLIKCNVFERVVLLSRRLGPGTVEKILNISGNKKDEDHAISRSLTHFVGHNGNWHSGRSTLRLQAKAIAENKK